MAKTMKRLACLAVTVLLLTALVVAGTVAASAEEADIHCYLYGDVQEDGEITNMDAIQLLYISLGVDEKPGYQDCDIDGDGVVTNLDAIKLLYMYMLGEETQIVHLYYAPVWDWSNPDNVSVTFLCGCGKSHTYSKSAGTVTVTTVQDTDVTCTAAGVLELKATVTVDGQEYSNTYLDVTPAAGHTVSSEGMKCWDEPRQCDNCDYVAEPPLHVWEIVGTDLGSCKTHTIEHQECKNEGCEAKRDLDLGLGTHTYGYVADGDRALGNCTYVKTYKCSACDDVIDGTGENDTYTKHTYKVVLEEATCNKNGTKKQVCTICNHSLEPETIEADPSKHVWNDGESSNGVITYTCRDCAATKKAVDATSDGKVNTDQLDQEVALPGGANLTMDAEAQAGLPEDTQVVITVVEKAPEDLGLSPEKEQELKNAIGENPVYDFNMSNANSDAITNFNGTVTISLPYELGEDEDVDAIYVWYITDDGEIDTFKATYSNGFVTFETNHFSYYTVTRLTPKQRCDLYGHAWVEKHSEPSCTVDGVHSKICQRCGEMEYGETVPMTGHSYVETGCTATCTEGGLIIKTCEKCSHVVNIKVDKLGHILEVNEDLTVEATCQAPGKVVSTCTRCNETYIEETKQLQHQFENSTHVDATCTTGGYDKGVCTLCGQEQISNETLATGHSYKLSGDWAWSDDYSSATAVLVCEHDKTHTHSLKASVSVSPSKAPCVGKYTAVYTATASFNNKTYTGTTSVEKEGAGHVPSQDWSTNATQHYHTCTACGEAIYAASHTFKDVSVDKAPTCVVAGSKTVACTVCGYKTTESVPATGNHTYVNGTCSSCGKKDDTCEHLITYPFELDTSNKGICGNPEIILEKCDCGMIHDVSLDGFVCEIKVEEKEETLPDGSVYYISTGTCPDCGLVMHVERAWVVDTENCAAEDRVVMSMSIGGEELFRIEQVNAGELHPCTIEVTEFVLTGFCGDPVMVSKKCPCGEITRYSFENGHSCTFSNQEYSENGELKVTCIDCGGTQTTSVTWKDENCLRYIYRPYKFQTKDGVVVADFIETTVSEYHNNVLDSCELQGETCEDGLIVRYTCADCGEKQAYYTQSHDMILEETIEIPGLCGGYVTVRSCPCPMASCDVFMEGEKQCNWVWNAANPDTGLESMVCTECGIILDMYTKYLDKDENCNTERQMLHIFRDPDYNEILSVTARFYEIYHNYKTQVTLHGDSCLDGGYTKEYCADCGEVMGEGEFPPSDEHFYNVSGEEIDLAELGFCGGYLYYHACACGEIGTVELNDYYCEYKELEDGTRQCINCGMTVEEEYFVADEIDPCHELVRHSVIIRKDGQVVLSKTADYIEEGHDTVAEYTLLGETCEDGYYVKQTCQTCGEVVEDGSLYDQVEYGHSPYGVERIPVYDAEDICGPVYIYFYRCACGYETSCSVAPNCGNISWEYDEETGTEHLRCMDCGLELHETILGDEPTDTPCHYIRKRNITLKKDGTTLASKDYDDAHQSHDVVATFNLLGETCEDGYHVKRVCQTCGMVEYDSEEYGEPLRGCNAEVISRTDIANGQACGPIWKIDHSCACGNESRTRIEESGCIFVNVGYDTETDSQIYVCEGCGIEKYTSWEEKATGVPCQYTRGTTCIYYQDEVELGRATSGSTYINHKVVQHTLTLLGETCEEGYTVAETCLNCGKEQTLDDTYYGSSYEWNVDLTELCNEEGTCGKLYLVKFAHCACEDDVGYRIEGTCDLSYAGYTEDGNIYRCANCGLEAIWSDQGYVIPEECQRESTFKYVVNYEGQQLASGEKTYRAVWHDTYATFEMNGESCTDGYYTVEKCAYCDYEERSSYEQTDHRQYNLGEIGSDVLGCCEGSYIQIYGCACGQECYIYDYMYGCQNTTYTYDEATQTSTESCADCGLVITRESVQTPIEGSCDVLIDTIYTVSIKGVVKYHMKDQGVLTEHDMVVTVTLKDGASSCTDGISVKETCKNCSHLYSYESEDHVQFEQESIDLAPYGSACGGQLVHTGCACGKSNNWELEGCEPGYQPADDAWIENVMEDDGRHTTHGYHRVSSSFEDVCCAVTNANCSLQLRKAEYWVQEGCAAVEYINWRYFDGTNWVDLCNDPTGEKAPWHNYVEKSGDDLQGYTYWAECACGAYDRYTETRNELGERISMTREIVEAPGNGFNQRYELHEEFTKLGDSLMYTLEKCAYYDSNGNYSYGHHITYSYDTANCTRTIAHYNHQGVMQNERTETFHVTSYKSTTIKENTCTQFGYVQHEQVCENCGISEDVQVQTMGPMDHLFDWSEEKQTYVCYRCGLESIKPGSGAIVLEDLTAAYGQGTDYVVGYYNPQNIQYVVNASVILYDVAEGEEDQILLEGISFTSMTHNSQQPDTINAESCSIQQVRDAALAALENYSGSYAIRISFVPVNDSTDLDYAITFDSQEKA